MFQLARDFRCRGRACLRAASVGGGPGTGTCCHLDARWHAVGIVTQNLSHALITLNSGYVTDVAGLRWVNEHFLGWRQERSANAPVTCGLWDFERSWRKNLPALQVVLLRAQVDTSVGRELTK